MMTTDSEAAWGLQFMMKLATAGTMVMEDCNDPSARAYAHGMIEAVRLGPEAVETQILYILNNTGSWRGETARQAKAIYREWLRAFRAESREKQRERKAARR